MGLERQGEDWRACHHLLRCHWVSKCVDYGVRGNLGTHVFTLARTVPGDTNSMDAYLHICPHYLFPLVIFYSVLSSCIVP